MQNAQIGFLGDNSRFNESRPVAIEKPFLGDLAYCVNIRDTVEANENLRLDGSDRTVEFSRLLKQTCYWKFCDITIITKPIFNLPLCSTVQSTGNF